MFNPLDFDEDTASSGSHSANSVLTVSMFLS
jgi:hypothetical protein